MALSPQRRYQDELKRYGLGLGGIQSPSKLTFDAPVKGGSVQRKLRGGIGSSGAMRTPFAEDGAGAVGYDFDQEQFPDDPLAGLTREESIDYLVSMGIDMENPTLGMSEIVERAKNRPQSVLPNISSDVGSISEFAEAYAKLAETNRPEPSISERPDMVSLMGSNPSAFADSPLDVIAAQIAKAETPANSGSEVVANDGEIVQNIIAKNTAKAGLAEEARLFDDIGVDKTDTAMEDALIGSMNPYLEAINKKIPTAESREDLLKKYKKEFSEATGIEIDGKVDKSQALMAMGLSLMQNRAGKGFNVGKILNAVGQAGDKAMPYLREATKEAKAAKVAAGKYALSKIASGESAAAALSKERRLATRAFNLEMYKVEADLEKERIKAGAKGVEYENVKAIEPVKDLDIHYGTTKDGRTVLAKAAGDAGRLASKFNAYSKAQVILNGMEASLEEIANNKSPTLDKVTAKINGLLVGFGLKDAQVTFGDSKISPEDQVAKARQTLINEFKRALLQESQVSDLDLKGLFDSLGDQGIFENPNVPIEAIKNMRGYFGNKKADLEPVILQFRDNYFYRNEDEFNKVQEVLDNAFIKKYQTKGVAKKDRTFVDLTEQGDV